MCNELTENRESVYIHSAMNCQRLNIIKQSQLCYSSTCVTTGIMEGIICVTTNFIQYLPDLQMSQHQQ